MKKLKTLSQAALATAATLFSGVGLAMAQLRFDEVPQVSGSAESIIQRVGGWILGIAGGIAVLWLIYGGIIYITGGEKGAESGKKIIINAIIGLAVIGLASLIATLVIEAIGG